MHLGKLGRGLAAMTAIVTLCAACTPEPGPTPTPTPSAPASPTETELERQERLDYEAAEKSYRTFRAEFGRVLRAGGATSATPEMKRTAAGSYLKNFAETVQAFEGLGGYDRGAEKILYVRHGGYSSDSLILNVCEDSRDVRTYDEGGKQVGVGELRTAQLEVRKVKTAWMLWSGEGKKVASCE